MRRPVFDAHWAAEAEYAVYERNRVAPGDAISGPALIAEDQTTTVVTAAFHVRVDGACNLILTRKDAL
jgi:N-methylhydantoinase A